MRQASGAVREDWRRAVKAMQSDMARGQAKRGGEKPGVGGKTAAAAKIGRKIGFLSAPLLDRREDDER